MSKKDRDELGDAIGRVIDINRHTVSIEPDFVAQTAMQTIRFDYALHNAGWYGCYQHMLQLARERLRGKFDLRAVADAAIAGEDLFPETLQDRYPRKPHRDKDGEWAEPVYVLRSHLSAEDRWYNIDRLDHISVAAARHKDALEAETVAQFGPRREAA